MSTADEEAPKGASYAPEEAGPNQLSTYLTRAIGGVPDDDAVTAMLSLIAVIVVRNSRDLPTALDIVRGFPTDLEAAVTALFNHHL